MSVTFYPNSVKVRISTFGRSAEFSPEEIPLKQLQNLQVLFYRTQPGMLLRVNREGCLEFVEGFWNRFSYRFNRKAEEAAVKQVVSETLENYNRYLQVCRDERTDRFAVEQLFQRIGHLSPNILDRSHFYSHNKLSEYTRSANTVRLKIGNDFIDFTDPEFSEVENPFLELDLGSAEDNANFAFLLQNEQAGDRLRVDVWGRLQKASGFSFKCERGDQENRVREVVSRVLGQLNETLSKMEMTRTHKVVLNRIFTQGPLTRMRPVVRKPRGDREVLEGIYDRAAIREGSCLERILGETFDSRLQETRTNFKDELKAFNLLQSDAARAAAMPAVEAKFMDLLLEEYYFAYQLGVDLERVGDGGSGGARYARDRYGRKILVVKPGDEGPHGPNNPQWYAKIKRWFVSPRECMKGNSEPLSEVDSYLFDRSLGIYQVPPTEWRYIASRQFNGEVFKECSVQMFVQGCETMSDYVNISSKMFSMPRSLLRWYFGEEHGLLTRGNKRRSMLEKVPQASAERLAAHNLGIEDIDCHFENVLVMLRNEGGEPSLIECIFRGERVEENAIDDFVDTFFAKSHNQAVLQAILFSESIEINGERKRVTFIKHDGGSSNPRSHPKGYLPTRFKHLFEVLPNFEASFSEDFKDTLKSKNRLFIEFLFEKSARALRNTLTPEVFRNYWESEENRHIFKLWILETDTQTKEDLRSKVKDALMEVNGFELNDQSDRAKVFRAYFNSNLERIEGNIATRLDSWLLLQKFANSDRPMREALLTCTQKDFDRELTNMDGFHENCLNELEEAKRRVVKRGGTCMSGAYFVGNHVLVDLGERGYAVG